MDYPRTQYLKKGPKHGAVVLDCLSLELSELRVHNCEPFFEASFNRLEELDFLFHGHRGKVHHHALVHPVTAVVTPRATVSTAFFMLLFMAATTFLALLFRLFSFSWFHFFTHFSFTPWYPGNAACSRMQGRLGGLYVEASLQDHS